MDVFCAIPELTADVIRRAAKAAGVHLYLKSGNAGVYADAGFVSVQALEDGEVAVDFGETGDIVDAMTGEKVGEGPVYSVSLKAGDARLFRVISAKGGALPPHLHKSGGKPAADLPRAHLPRRACDLV